MFHFQHTVPWPTPLSLLDYWITIWITLCPIFFFYFHLHFHCSSLLLYSYLPPSQLRFCALSLYHSCALTLHFLVGGTTCLAKPHILLSFILWTKTTLLTIVTKFTILNLRWALHTALLPFPSRLTLSHSEMTTLHLLSSKIQHLSLSALWDENWVYFTEKIEAVSQEWPHSPTTWAFISAFPPSHGCMFLFRGKPFHMAPWSRTLLTI